jgi:hypothetical protein
MTKLKMMSLMALLGILLAACGAPSAPPIVPTQPPSTPTQAPSVLPTLPPSPIKPGGGLVTRPEADAWSTAPQAALNARADLAQRLQVDIDTIGLVSVEHVDWPDGCMGIHTPGVMCTMVITPGYKVVLEANGQQYEYHTTESGSVVRLVGG